MTAVKHGIVTSFKKMHDISIAQMTEDDKVMTAAQTLVCYHARTIAMLEECPPDQFVD